jgi:hypothetical protein
LLTELNQREGQRAGEWKLDSSELASAVKFQGSDGTLAASTLAPDDVANAIVVLTSAGEVGVAAG